jgi:hypothetical protein
VGLEAGEEEDVKHLLWIIPLVAGVAAIQWPRPMLLSVALAAMLVCAVIWIVSILLRGSGSSLARPANEDRSEQNRDPLGVQRDIPPPS